MKRVYFIVALLAVATLTLMAQESQAEGDNQTTNARLGEILNRYDSSSDLINKAKQNVSILNNLDPCDYDEPVVQPIQHLFSVANDLKVKFSTGNLRYNIGKKEWSFHQHQYDYVGMKNQYIGYPDYDGYIDLFGKSTDGKFGVNPSNNIADYSGSFIDWGVNIGEHWRTLTSDEWRYLIQRKDANGKPLWAMAQINNTMSGLLLLPDDWSTPDGITLVVGDESKPQQEAAVFTVNAFNFAQWNILEVNGAVFLPMPGVRVGGYRNFCTREGNCPDGYDQEKYCNNCALSSTGYYDWVDQISVWAKYWSSTNKTNSTTESNYLIFSVEPGYSGYSTFPTIWSETNRYGMAVRLVYDEDYVAEVPIVPTPKTYTYKFYVNNVDYASVSDVDEGTSATEAFAKSGKDNPTKESIIDKVYTFSGWTHNATLSSADVLAYDAVFTESTRQYTITFMSENCAAEIDTLHINYGATILDNESIPAPPAKANYDFKGWQLQNTTSTYLEALTKVTGDAVYCATYQPTNKWKVRLYANSWEQVHPYVWHTARIENDIEIPEDEYNGEWPDVQPISRVAGMDYFETEVKTGYNIVFYTLDANGAILQTEDIRNIQANSCYALGDLKKKNDNKSYYTVSSVACDSRYYQVLGSSVIFGGDTDWEYLDANKMTLEQSEEGSYYTLTLENVSLEACETYMYKVVRTMKDLNDNVVQTWYPAAVEGNDNNATIKVDFSGTYNITIKFAFDEQTDPIADVESVEVEQVMVKFNANDLWQDVYAYSWKDGNSKCFPLGEWRGTKLTITSDGYYEIAIPTGYSIIFNDVNNNQTSDLGPISEDVCYSLSYSLNSGYTAEQVDCEHNEQPSYKGAFSVAEDKLVIFAPGNLQYNAATDKWRFADKQYAIVGADNANRAANYDGWIDLFGWGTSGWNNSGANAYQPWAVSTDYKDYFVGGSYQNNLTGDFANADWGVFNAIGNDAAGTWRVLTNSEWAYLIDRTDKNGKALWAPAKIKSVYGILLLPDGYDNADVELARGSYGTFFNDNINELALETWSKLEKQGVIFLPVTYFRKGTEVENVNKGYYWLSTANVNLVNEDFDPVPDREAFVMYFTFENDSVMSSVSRNRSYGNAVRLVKDADEATELDLIVEIINNWAGNTKTFKLQKDDAGKYAGLLENVWFENQNKANYKFILFNGQERIIDAKLITNYCTILLDGTYNLTFVYDPYQQQASAKFSLTAEAVSYKAVFRWGNEEKVCNEVSKDFVSNYVNSGAVSPCEDVFKAEDVVKAGDECHAYSFDGWTRDTQTKDFFAFNAKFAEELLNCDKILFVSETLTGGEEIEMTSEDGTEYTAVVSGVQLSSGDYPFVVLDSGDPVGGADLSLPVDYTGKYDVSVRYNVETGSIAIAANPVVYDVLFSVNGVVVENCSKQMTQEEIEAYATKAEIPCDNISLADIVLPGSTAQFAGWVIDETVTSGNITLKPALVSSNLEYTVHESNIFGSLKLKWNENTKVYEYIINGYSYEYKKEYGNFLFVLLDADEKVVDTDLKQWNYTGKYDISIVYNPSLNKFSVTIEPVEYLVDFEVNGIVSTDCSKRMTPEQLSAFIEAAKAPDCLNIDIPENCSLVWAQDKTITTGNYTLSAVMQYKPYGGFAVGETTDEKTGVKVVKYISIAKSNLQYDFKNDKWQFAEHAYDMIGEENGSNIKNRNFAIDLFNWATSGYDPCGNGQYSPGTYNGVFPVAPGQKPVNLTDEYSLWDWGVYNNIGSDPAGTWRTPASDEWLYLLSERENAQDLSGFATVNGVKGFVLLPDIWNEPYGLTFTPFSSNNLSYSNYIGNQQGRVDVFAVNNYDFSANTYSADEWTQMENWGARFLPAAGWRFYLDADHNGEEFGYYWSTTRDGTQPRNFKFNKSEFIPDFITEAYNNAGWGMCVRLIKDMNSPVVSQQSESDSYYYAVGDGKYVQISNGNLVKDNDTYTFSNWQFEAGSYFKWNASDIGSALTSETDWGANVIDGEPAGTYRTMTYDEWNYLISREEKGMQATVFVQNNVLSGESCNATGFIVLPENWEEPDNLGVDLTYNNKSAFTDNVLTLSQWKIMEAAGAVFLPAAGRITDGSDDNVTGKDESGFYWSSTTTDYYPVQGVGYSLKVAQPIHIYSAGFAASALTPSPDTYNNFKYSVRLVKDYSTQQQAGYVITGENNWLGDDLSLELNSLDIYTATTGELSLAAGTYNYSLSYNGDVVKNASLTINYDGVYKIAFGYYYKQSAGDYVLEAKINKIISYNVAFVVNGEVVCNSDVPYGDIASLIKDGGSLPSACESYIPSSATFTWEKDNSVSSGKYTLIGTLQSAEDYYFKVGNNKYVKFSKGNLASTTSFTEHQYDLGEYFDWNGKSANEALTSENDWGNAQINNESAGTYRTLTYEEWKYVMDNQGGQHINISIDNSTSIRGYILLPYNWVAPEGLNLNFQIDGKMGYFENNTLSLSQWKQLEFAGAVFLPASGYKLTLTEDELYKTNECYYWTASVGDVGNQFPYYLRIFNPNWDYPTSTNVPGSGWQKMQVRLVKDYADAASKFTLDFGNNVQVNSDLTTEQDVKEYVKALNQSENVLNPTDGVQISKEDESGNVFNGWDYTIKDQIVELTPRYVPEVEVVTNNVDDALYIYALADNGYEYYGSYPGQCIENCNNASGMPRRVNGSDSGNSVEVPAGVNIVFSNGTADIKTDEIEITKKTCFSVAIASGKITAEIVDCENEDEEDAPKGAFSVGETTDENGNEVKKYVRFAKGNLQYNAKQKTWRFAENQYDIVGSDNTNIAEDYDGWIDLFGWATSGSEFMPYSSTNSHTYYADDEITSGSWSDNDDTKNYDWGVYNKIGNYSAGTWRTLTSDEWKYMAERTDKNGNLLYSIATVAGVKGYVFLPDNFNLPDDLSFTNAVSQNFAKNTYDADEWAKMEEAGAIFLPNAGQRSGTTYGTTHCYWSSTAMNTNKAYSIRLVGNGDLTSSANNYTAYTRDKYYGYAVRLVTEGDGIEPEPELSFKGAFTVADDMLVKFAPGNLQYNAAQDKWQFAGKQSAFIGKDNDQRADDYDGWIDLFAWGTSGEGDMNPWDLGDKNNASDFGYSGGIADTDYDWGIKNAIGSYKAGTWHTPSSDNWNYVFKERDKADDLWFFAKIGTVTGIILLPDEFENTYKVSFTAGDKNNISSDDWTKLESEGAVLLPVCGSASMNGTKINVVNYIGENAEMLYYWSTTDKADDDTRAYQLRANYTNTKLTGTAYYDYKSRACAVRLIKPFDPYSDAPDPYEPGGDEPQQTGKAFKVGEDANGEAVLVYLAPGNLQYNAKSDKWRFATNQYDFVGDDNFGNVYEGDTKCDNLKTASDYDGWIDMFGYGTSGFNEKYPWLRSNSRGSYHNEDIAGTSYDWGVNNQIGDDKKGVWRTMTKEEWDGLIQYNTYALATVNDVRGVIFLPPSFSYPAGFEKELQAGYTGNYTKHTYSAEEWAALEQEGAVFLPAGGSLNPNSSALSDLSDTKAHSYYWASTVYTGNNDRNAYAFHATTNTSATKGYERYMGYNVRLVKDVNAQPVTVYTLVSDKTIGANKEWEMTKVDDNTYTLSLTDVRLYRNESFSLYAAADGQSLQQENTTFDVDYEGDYNLTFTYVVNSAGVTVEKEIVKYLQVHFCDRDGNILCDNRSYERTPAEIDNLGDYNPCDADLDYDDEYINYVHSGWTHGESVVAGSYSLYPVYTKQPKNETAEIKFWTDWAEVYANDYDPEKDATVREKLSKSPDGWYRYNVDVWHNISFDNNKGLSTRSADEILQPYCFVLGDLSVGEGDTHALYDLVEDCDWSDTDMKNTTKTVTVRLFTNWKNVYAHAYLKGYTLQPFGDDIGGGKTALRLVADGENGMFDYAWYSFELPYVEDSYIHPAYMVDFYGSNGKDVKTDSTGVRVNTDRCFMTTESNGVWSKSGIKCGIGLQLKISGVDQLIAFDPAKTNSFKDVTLSAGTHEFILRYGTIQIVPYKASIDIATAGMYNIDVTWAYDEGRIDVETESLQAFQTGDNEFVRFADGNLQYKPSEAQWRLCETPWRSNDVYNFEDNISASYPHWLDIFGWVTSGWNSGAAAYQPYSLSENDADYLLIDRDHDGTYNYSLPYFAPNADWCVYNTIGDYQPSTWSTMDQGDWIYLLNLRKDAAKLAGLAYAYGHSGLIILPDGWVCPDGLTFNSFSDKGWTFNSQIWGYSGDDNGFSNHNSYFNKEWDKMVASGAVFIPAYTASIADYEHGYWTTSQSGKTTAVALQISETSVRLKELPKHTRLSVRPVKKNAVLPALETGYSIRQDINYVETLFEKDDEYNVYKANQLDVTVQHGTYTFTVYYNGTKHSETEVTIDLDGRYDFRYKLNPDGTGLQIDVNNDWYNNVSFNVDGKYIYSMDEIKQSRIDEILANGAYNPWMLSISRPDDSEYSYTFHSWEVDTEAETKGHKGLKAYFFPHQHPNLVRFKSDWSEVYVEEKDKSDGTLKTIKLSLANSGWYAYQYTEGNSVRFHNGFDGKGLSTRFIEVAESPRFLLDDISVKTGESRAFYDVKIGKLEDETKKTVTVRLFSDWNDVYAHAYIGDNTLQCFGDAISDGVMGLKLSTTESDETVFGYKWYAFEMPYKTGQNAYSVDFFGKKVNNVSTASDAVTVTKDMCFETNSVSGSWQKITIDCNTKMQVSVVSVNGTTKYDLDAENKCSVIEKPLSEETASVKLLYGGKQLADFSKDLSITANGVYNLDIAVLPDKSEIQVEVKKLKTFKIGTSIVGSTEYDLLVFFAPGNLQYNAKEDKWRFSKDESDHIAGGNRYLSSDYNGWVDLFGWGTSGWTNGKKEYQPYLVSETCYDFPYLQVPVGEMYSPLFSNFDYNGDWAYQNQIDDYAPGTWQTMHSGNWKYVLGMRPDADQHVGYGKVKDHSGLILLPDDWELPSGCSWHPITYVGGTWNAGGFYDISSSTPYNYNSYNVESWAKMSEAGAVFLPLTGALTHTADGPEFEIWGDGYYWTSEQQSQCSAYCMRFSNERLYGGMTLDKNTGASVRPVRVFKVKKVE